MLNQVYSTHLQAQIQQHAASNHSQNFSAGRYRSSAHPHHNNHHVPQLQHHTHHQYLQHDHEHEAYSHQGWYFITIKLENIKSCIYFFTLYSE